MPNFCWNSSRSSPGSSWGGTGEVAPEATPKSTMAELPPKTAPDGSVHRGAPGSQPVPLRPWNITATSAQHSSASCVLYRTLIACDPKGHRNPGSGGSAEPVCVPGHSLTTFPSSQQILVRQGWGSRQPLGFFLPRSKIGFVSLC